MFLISPWLINPTLILLYYRGENQMIKILNSIFVPCHWGNTSLLPNRQLAKKSWQAKDSKKYGNQSC